MLRISFTLLVLFSLCGKVMGQKTLVINKNIIDYDSALITKSYTTKLLPLFQNKRTTTLETSKGKLTFFFQAYSLWSAGNYKESLALIKKWKPYIPKDDLILLTRIHFLEGENYFDNFEDNKAIQALIQADVLSEKTKKTDLIIAIKQYRANVYLTLGNFVLAKKVIENSWQYYKRCTNINQKSAYLMVYVSLMNQMAIAEKDDRYSEKAIFHIHKFNSENSKELTPELQGHLLAELC